MATTSAVRDEGLGNLEDFIRAVHATRERLEGGGDLEALDDAVEAAEPLQERVEALASLAVALAEHAVETDVTAAMRTLQELRDLMAKVNVSIHGLLDELADAREGWDREEEEGAGQLDGTQAGVMGQLEAAAEALAELRAGVAGLQREQEGTDSEVEADLRAAGLALAQAVAATVQALVPHLDDLDAIADAAEKAGHCQVVQSVVMIVVAVFLAVVAVVAAIFTGGAALALVVVVAAVAAALASLVAVTLSPETICAIGNGAAILLRVAGAEEASDSLLAALACAVEAMERAEAMAGGLAPMLPQVSVVSELADGVQRLLSALNPFD